MLNTIRSSRATASARLQQMKDVFGYNLAALNYMKREIEANSSSKVFGPAPETTLSTALAGPMNKRGEKLDEVKKKKKRKSKPKGDKAKKKRDRSSSSDTSSSSSDRSSHSVSSETAAKRKKKKKKTSSQRKREPPFKPGEEEINAIFMQLVTNIPFAHPRRNVNQAWKFHFRALHDKGVALDCTKQKTFTAWATRMCQCVGE
jgi:hypothetical protein